MPSKKKKPKLGRPKIEVHRDQSIVIWLSLDERDAVKKKADDMTLSVSAYARKILLEAR